MRIALLVLGMHRSGTSAIAGVLDALGIGGPSSMMPADEANPRGYFESARLFAVLDELLAAAGSGWDDWRQFEPQWFDSQAAQQHRQAVKARLIEDFDDRPLIYIKDPRICRFVPFVSSVLAEIGITPVAVLPLRNPLEIASSLQHRYQFAPAKSILLWLRHQLDAEFYSRGMPRCFVSYDDLLLDWRAQIDRMAEQIGVTWPDRSDRSSAVIDQFLQVELHRHRTPLADFKNHPLVAPLARESYEILLDVVARGEHGVLLDRLDRIRTDFNEGCRTFGPAIAEAVPAYNRVIGELNKSFAACSRLTAERDSLIASNRDLLVERDRLAAQCRGPSEQGCAAPSIGQSETPLPGRGPLPIIKRALLGLADRAGYSILKNADREQLGRRAADCASAQAQSAHLEAKLVNLEHRLAATDAELAALKERSAQAAARLAETEAARDQALLQLGQAGRQLDEQNGALQRLEHDLEKATAQVWSLRRAAENESANQKSPTGLSGQRAPGGLFYIVHFPFSHDWRYGENLSEFFAEAGVSAATILLDDPTDGQRPQLAECLCGDALGVIGFNSQLDHSYIGAIPFLEAAAKQRVPVIQWILDHPSSRLTEFGNSTAANSRFLFSSKNAERYFRRFGLKHALTASVACVGPNRHSRIRNFSFADFSRRPIAAMMAMNLRRIGGTIDDAWARVLSLEPALRLVVEEAIERSYADVIEPLETHFEAALSGRGLVIDAANRHICMQMLEEVVQIRRRQEIFKVARRFPILIQSDAASRPFQAGAKAIFKEDQDDAVTWARLKLTRAQVCISNMHDMVHDRILNGLNAGCMNIVEDSAGNRRIFEHGRDALFFRYGDDSLRECLEFALNDIEGSYDIAAAGFARRDDAPLRFGDFRNIIDLAGKPVPDDGDLALAADVSVR